MSVIDPATPGISNEAPVGGRELQRLRAVFEQIADGIIVADEFGTILDWNPAALRLHGCETADELQRNAAGEQRLFVVTHLDGEVVPAAEWPLRWLVRDDMVRDEELCITRVESGAHWIIRISRNVVPGDGDKDNLIVLTLHDATEEFRAAAAAREAEQRILNKRRLLHTLLEGISDPIFVKSAELRFMFVNSGVSRLAGKTPDECIGLDDIEMFGEAIGRDTQRRDRLVLESAEPLTYDESVVVNGETRHFLVSKSRFFNAQGAVAGLIGISRDITSRRIAEEAVKNSEQHLREVVNSLIVAVMTLTTDGRVNSMNGAARQMVQVDDTASESAGMLITGLPWVAQSPEACGTLREAVSQAARGESVFLKLLRVRQSEGEKIYDVSVAPMHDADGAIGHLVLSAVDMTDQTIAEERAREQQAELAHLERVQTMGHIASGLAHELNQPLGAIVNYAAAYGALLETGRIDAAMLSEAFKSIGGEAMRAGDIIRRLRSFVQKQSPQPSEVDIAAVIQEAVRILAYDLRQADIQPRVVVEPRLGKVSADAVQITQVLVNLMRNAMDAMQAVPAAKRFLRVSAERMPADIVRITVQDRGLGVGPQEMARLFDAFYTTKSNGLGIGLALCRMIVEKHNGQISAARNSDGGMNFSFTLRLSAMATSSKE